MNYGELRTHFLDLLNRDDCSDALADRFISMGLRRVERLLRTPIQKTEKVVTVDSNWDDKVTIPSDYLGVYQITKDGVGIPRVSPLQSETVYGFYIERTNFVFNIPVNNGDEIKITYYNEFASGVSDGTQTDYSVVFPDITVYAALSFAGDYFEDARLDRWNNRFKEISNEAQMMADKDEIAGGMSIRPMGGGIV